MSSSKEIVLVKIIYLAVAVALLSHSGASKAQVQVTQEYDKLIREHGQIVGLGNDLFGDKIGLYTGGLRETVSESLPRPKKCL